MGHPFGWKVRESHHMMTNSGSDPPLDISTATSMTVEDVCTALTQNGMLYARDVTPPPARPSPGQSIKYPKGRKNGIARRHLQRKLTKDDENSKHPFVTPTDYQISWDREIVNQYLANWENKGYLRLKPEKLKWSPFLLSRVKTGSSQETPKPTETTSVQEMQNHAPSTSSKAESAMALKTSSDDSSPVDISTLKVSTIEEEKDDCPVATIPSSPGKATRSVERAGSLRRQDEITSVPKRTLRNSSTHTTPSHLKPVGDENAHGSPPLTVRTRSRSSRSTKASDDTVVDDVVARPDELRRSRRSHAATTASDAGSRRDVPTLSNSRASSPRKRRRVESSPEATASPVKIMNGRKKSSRPPRKRKPSRVVDESDTEEDTTVLTPVRSSTVEICDDESGKAVLSRDDNLVEEHDPRNSSPELKSEDSGTSLTSLTSGQSVVNDEAGSPMEVDGIPASPDISRRQVEEPHSPQIGDCIMQDVKVTSPLPMSNTYALPDDGEDADADGEYEEDAEGEPDVEFLGTY